MSKPKHFLDLDAVDAAHLRAILDQAKVIKQARAGKPKAALDEGAPLDGYMLAAIFELESSRTRMSFDIGMRQLGGQTVVLTGREMNFGEREPVSDTAKLISRYADVVLLRTLRHDLLLELAENADIPVINGLTERTHPCQIMADIMTVEEHRGPIAGKVLTWCGDGNNVAASFVHAAAAFDFELRLACPDGYRVDSAVVEAALRKGANVVETVDPRAAVDGADCVIADTFVSMGQADRDVRLADLAPFQVNEELMTQAKSDALFLHCLPAHRGEEVTPSVIDGAQSVVWDEAENRLHAQKAILLWCLDRG